MNKNIEYYNLNNLNNNKIKILNNYKILFHYNRMWKNNKEIIASKSRH